MSDDHSLKPLSVVKNIRVKNIKGDDKEVHGDAGARGLNPYEQGSILIDPTDAMENARRKLEQTGHSRFARVNASHRPDYEVSPDNDLQAQAGPKEHPYLDSQRFDGIDPSLNPAPDIGTEARREFDNERRNQEQEKQHRLGNMPTNSRRNTPEFKP